jgi:predicted lipase
MMLDDTLHLIENLFIPQNFKVVVKGHSLGAGVASLLGIFLKQAFPEMDLKVYAFATPARKIT